MPFCPYNYSESLLIIKFIIPAPRELFQALDISNEISARYFYYNIQFKIILFSTVPSKILFSVLVFYIYLRLKVQKQVLGEFIWIQLF